MKLLADESIDLPIAESLRRDGHFIMLRSGKAKGMESKDQGLLGKEKGYIDSLSLLCNNDYMSIYMK